VCQCNSLNSLRWFFLRKVQKTLSMYQGKVGIQNLSHIGGLWVPVVMVVCEVVCAGCVCAVHPCCFVSLTCTSAPKYWQTTAYWGLPECSQ
jgi:hypothetical protein